MSSALAMILTSAMAVSGSGTEKVSGEVEEHLDLRGRWEGPWEGGSGEQYRVELCNYVLTAKDKRGGLVDRVTISSVKTEGDGKVRFVLGPTPCLGIFRYEGDRLLICFRDVCYRGIYNVRPTSFRATEDQWLFTLHRVKPRK